MEISKIIALFLLGIVVVAGASCISAKSFNCIQSTPSNPTFVCGVADIDNNVETFYSLTTMTKYLNENLNPKSIQYYTDGFSKDNVNYERYGIRGLCNNGSTFNCFSIYKQ